MFAAVPLYAAEAKPNSSSAGAQKPHKHGTYYGGKAIEHPSWFKESFLDLRKDIRDAEKSHKRVMLMFTQDNCPYCNQLVERNLAQRGIEDTLKKKFDVIAINM